MLPSLQSTKVPRDPILITENEGEKYFRASRGMITTTRLYLAAFKSINALICRPAHPWGASDGPDVPLLHTSMYVIPHDSVIPGLPPR